MTAWRRLPQHIVAGIEKHLVDAPVRLSAIAEEFGVEVLKAQLPSGISGEISPSVAHEGRFVIRVNRNDISRRQRFTVAHELGHFFLHQHVIGTGVTDDVLYRSGLSDAIEAEANRFAADLLMPMPLVEKWLEYAHTLRVPDPVEFLADKFNVSEAAMRIRLGLK